MLGDGGALAGMACVWLPLWITLFCSRVFQDMVINFLDWYMDELGPDSTCFQRQRGIYVLEILIYVTDIKSVHVTYRNCNPQAKSSG